MRQPLESVVMGSDEERHICAGGSDEALRSAKTSITRRCKMPGTGSLPEYASRWHFPRFFAPVAGASFYYDYDEIYESQSAESESPFRLVAVQDATRECVRDALGRSNVQLGGCGYVRDRRGLGYRFAGSHLNISFNAPGFAGCRTAMVADAVQQVMLFFLATNQPWEGIGAHWSGDWQLRCHAITTDISNNCSDNRGVLQPGRQIPQHEVKEQEVFHYTHYESGWARSQYQRALAAAVVAIDLHLACHRAVEVASRLEDAGRVLGPDLSWHTTKHELSGTLGGDVKAPVRVAQRHMSLLEVIDLRLSLYDWMLSDALQIPWVNWAVAQLHSLRSALGQYDQGVQGPLWGLDSIVKLECIYRPWAAGKGLDLKELWRERSWMDWRSPRPQPSPDTSECLNELFGYNLLYHDFTHPGLYEDILDANPHIRRRQELPQVAALRAGGDLPLTRGARRHLLTRIYADLHAASGRRLTPCFAGFDRIALMVQQETQTHTCLHYLGDVLLHELTEEDIHMVRRMAGLAGADPEPVLRAHSVSVGGAESAPPDRAVA
jgi:hypothetical protein